MRSSAITSIIVNVGKVSKTRVYHSRGRIRAYEVQHPSGRAAHLVRPLEPEYLRRTE